MRLRDFLSRLRKGPKAGYPSRVATHPPLSTAEEAARLRRRVALVWRHRAALARATALAVPLLWALTGKATDLTHRRRR